MIIKTSFCMTEEISSSTISFKEEMESRGIAFEILESIRASARAMLDVHQAAFKKLWFNPKATRAQIFAALGENGLHVLTRGGDMIGFLLGEHTGRPIASMQPEEYTPPQAYSVAPDGVVSIL